MWDKFTEKHFKEWAEYALPKALRQEAEKLLRDFTEKHPDVLESWSWREMLDHIDQQTNKEKKS